LLAGVKPAFGAAAIRGLDRPAVEDGRHRLPLASFLPSRQVTQAVMNLLPNSSDAPGARVAIDGLPGRALAGQVAPLATCAVDVKDGVNSQAHIGLTLPSARFRGGDPAFDILPFSVGQVTRVELVAHQQYQKCVRTSFWG
jgi:hypothetical protein